MPHERCRHFFFVAMPESLSAARSCVRGVLQGCNRADKEMDVNIVVGEILQNVIDMALTAAVRQANSQCNFSLVIARLKSS